MPDINDFVAGMKVLLKPEGVITLEFPHIEKLIAENPVRHHLSRALFLLFTADDRKNGPPSWTQGLRCRGDSHTWRFAAVFFSHEDSRFHREARVDSLLERELNAGLDRIETYTAFAEAVRQTKRNLLSFLIRLKEMRKSICAYGAPGRGNTLLNYCGIGTDFIDFAVDRNLTNMDASRRECISQSDLSAKSSA